MANRYEQMAKQTQAAAAAPRRPGSPWILGRWQDLALFVCTPLLILPLFFLAKTRLTIEDIALYVLAFGALGHHLPGMMRAYGDRALFERFRVRFIVAPIFLALLCIAFTLWELSAVVLAVYIWGAWHGLMQTYGFVRIYDGKKGSFEPITKKLDFYMCLTWIFCGVLWSPPRVYFLLDLYHIRCGAPLPSAFAISAIQYGIAGLTGLVTVAFLVNHLRLWKAGRAPSGIKLLLLATSIGFWWYANFAFSNMLVGVALFEIFHDVQYLSIVWVFNRSRADKDPNAGSFTRFLFRRSGTLIGVYVGMVFAYGSLQLVARGLPEATIKSGLTGLLAASGLLHFYYDGFIWKVREKKTGENLGIAGAAKEVAKRRLEIPGWLIHGAKWSLFVIPMALLGFTEPRHRADNFQRLEGLVSIIPRNPQVHQELARAYRENDEPQLAIEHYERAITLGLNETAPHINLGEIHLRRGDRAKARAEFTAALDLDPRSAPAVTNLGTLLAEEGKLADALVRHDRAIALDDKLAVAHLNRALVLFALGRGDEAEPAFRRAIELDDTSALAHRSVAGLYGTKGRLDDATRHYEAALAIEPDDVPTLVNFSSILKARGDLDGSEEKLRRAVQRRPRFAPSHFFLAETLLAKGDRAGALAHYRRTLELSPGYNGAQGRIDALLAEDDG